jgi:Asp-tRNA(Asn)/Glu-tRNA(Gln) amidotransferase A subunit family amidase
MGLLAPEVLAAQRAPRARVEALLGPAAPVEVVLDRFEYDKAGLEDYRNQATRMQCIAGLAGFPQLSLPLGTRLGAPLGISLLGPTGSDRSLVAERIAAAPTR